MASETDTRSLGELGERRILAELLLPRYRDVPAFGDDCAVFGRDLVATTDSCPTPLVASLGMNDPFHTGWLLATINLSDLAAAGATPDGLVVNYTLPMDTPVPVLKRIMDGVDACASSHGTRVLGGDICDGRETRLSATAVGRCIPGRRLSRSGAQAGDRLLLVGSPGYLWAAALLHHGWAVLTAAETEDVRERARRPVAQLEAGRLLAGHGLARAALDVSDGLYAGVRSLCEINDLGAAMHGGIDLDPVLRKVCEHAKVSTFQLGQTWGDWSLLVAVASADVSRARAVLGGAAIGVREVGRLTVATGVLTLETVDGPPRTWNGMEQERFTPSSWHGLRIDSYIQQLRSPATLG